MSVIMGGASIVEGFHVFCTLCETVLAPPLSVIENSRCLDIEQESKRRKIINSSQGCDHFFIRHGICWNCRVNLGKEYGRSFDFLLDGFQLNQRGVSVMKRHNTQQAHNEKKLHLVLDLDHTLLHSIYVSQLCETEKYLLDESDSREDLWRLNVEFLTKLRPFLHEFLREANELFTMYVYTMGNRMYAQEVLKLIDPQKVYFGNRVITRDDSGNNMKTLDIVLADERGVVIMDDTPSVWNDDHKRNLLQINKYNYFREIRSNSYAEGKTDESKDYGSLVNVLKVLKEVHRRFFCGGMLDLKDVRVLLQNCLMTIHEKYQHLAN